MARSTGRIVVALSLGALILGDQAASAGTLKRVSTIPVPGQPLDNFDISFVDQTTGRYYLADRSNSAVDIFDAATGTFVGRVAGFQGFHGSNDTAGPNGVVVVNDGAEAWVSDGDSTVKVVDLKTRAVTDTIATGGKARADEVGYDPKDHVLIAANNADDPPFATLISTEPGHKVLKRIVFDKATDGLEQAVYMPRDGMFYVSVPQLNHDKKLGGVAVIDPVKLEVVKTIQVADCAPAGLAAGPDNRLVLGCNAGQRNSTLPPRIVVVDTMTGATVASVPEIGAADMVGYAPGANQYYIAARQMRGGPVLGVIDAASNTLVQSLPTGGNAHSVAVVASSGHVLVPLPKTGGDCGGCIGIYAPE